MHNIPPNLAELLGAAAPELDWLRAPELVTIDGATYWHDYGTVAARMGALTALRSLGFDLDDRLDRDGMARVVRR